MRTVDTKLIEESVYSLALRAGTRLTPSCKDALNGAYNKETGDGAKFALNAVIENYKLAEEKNMPVCQDTGMAVVLMEIGQEVFLTGKLLKDAVNDGVERAYTDGYFRMSVCDPITRKNTATNTPAVIHTEIVEGDKINITFLPKGFGSENMSRIYMLTPAQGVEGIIDSVVNTVKTAGSRPCPPVYVGVGIGGTFDTSAFLAKKALTRDIGALSDREDVRYIEEECLKRINDLNIGAQGFKGDTTAIGVSCLISPTHIAGLPVAVNIQCHCVRCEKEQL